MDFASNQTAAGYHGHVGLVSSRIPCRDGDRHSSLASHLGGAVLLLPLSQQLAQYFLVLWKLDQRKEAFGSDPAQIGESCVQRPFVNPHDPTMDYINNLWEVT